MSNKEQGGLEGVSAGQTAICTVSKEGAGLSYRGYSISDLAKMSSFEEVAYLLLRGTLPNSKELSDYCEYLKTLRTLPQELKFILEQLPKSAHPMDVLRTGCSALGTLEPENESNQAQTILERLLSCFPSMLLYWYHYHQNNQKINFNCRDDSLAGYFLNLLHGKPASEMQRRCVDVSLILYAEHEFNASTFAARVTAATLSDVYSAVTSAIGTLRGPLHGGANEKAMELIEQFNSPEEASSQLKHMLAQKEKIMGFGHRVYTHCDPRSDVIKKWAKELAQTAEELVLYEVSQAIEKVMWDEKHLFPNLDFYSASAYHFCKIPTAMFTPIFVFARTAGWGAHIIEQRQNNRLIRPTAQYIGPAAKAYPAINER